jgi:hypothetical protein
MGCRHIRIITKKETKPNYDAKTIGLITIKLDILKSDIANAISDSTRMLNSRYERFKSEDENNIYLYNIHQMMI